MRCPLDLHLFSFILFDTPRDGDSTTYLHRLNNPNSLSLCLIGQGGIVLNLNRAAAGVAVCGGWTSSTFTSPPAPAAKVPPTPSPL